MSNADEPDELGQDLRRLFADERLTVPHSEGAGEAIVAGARRRRRRRHAATGSAVATGVLMLAGVAVAVPQVYDSPPHVASPADSDDGDARGQEPAEPTTPEASPEEDAADPGRELHEQRERERTTPRSPAAEVEPGEPGNGEHDGMTFGGDPTLGPGGYGALRIGMGFEDAREAGLLANAGAGPPEGCDSYTLAEGTDSVRTVRISASTGVAVIIASGAETPAGAEIGDTLDEVSEAHPGLDGDAGTYRAKAAEGAHYLFEFDEGVLERLSLRSDDPGEC
ncbi:hypothetical protein [Haloechinothrix sp. LS1_15]|uniref:hypothetical protein n=1 Tax=Haloechinothrix sp. LS1_15 TaxID=2652248 RepID=UPI0029482454|nr:hypothetical protein [Haloechinothrix sp. LS1_15]MDV6014533.1 hypothetical protein [Haloechinothrix sp. LS1_15]